MGGNDYQEYHKDEMKGQRDGNALCKLRCRILRSAVYHCGGLNDLTQWMKFPVTGKILDEKSPRREA